ncbi:prolipoprotein diacylglyceryl transferase [Elusimicrobiota bacterium]
MHPILFKLGPITIHTYGFILALGIFMGLQYILFKAKQNSISSNFMLDLVLFSVIDGLIGARLVYVVVNWGLYSNNIINTLKIWDGGLVFYGGLIFGGITGFTYTHLKKPKEIWLIADIFAPALAIGHFFGRIGCFFAGCCYGKECNLSWAVKFINPQSLAPLNVLLHPTQLYEALGNLIIIMCLIIYDKRKMFQGSVFAAYLFMYGFLRFIIEFFRGDDRGEIFLGLSLGQGISLLVIIFAIMLWHYRFSYDKKDHR